MGIFVGAILIIAAIAALVWAYSRKPDNLEGFYGAAYLTFFILCLIGGIALIFF